jgi:hypothetical protein
MCRQKKFFATDKDKLFNRRYSDLFGGVKVQAVVHEGILVGVGGGRGTGGMLGSSGKRQ